MALGKYRCSLKENQMPCTSTALQGQCYGKHTVLNPRSPLPFPSTKRVCVCGGGGVQGVFGNDWCIPESTHSPLWVLFFGIDFLIRSMSSQTLSNDINAF